MLMTVTGGAGRLGNALVRVLLERGHRVRVLEPGEGPVPPSLAGLSNIELVRGSVLDPEVVARIVQGAEVVYHVAAKVHLNKDRDGSLYAVNVRGTDHIVRAVAKTGGKLVHCSSHHALDREPLHVPLDELRPLALHEPCDYHRTKAQAEELVLQAVARREVDAVIVNPATMIGPWDFEPSMMGRALLSLAKRELPAVIDALTDYVDVRDVAEGMITAAEKGVRGERYLLSGEVLSLAQVLEAWGNITGVPQPRLCLPVWAAWAFIPAAAVWSMVSGKPAELTPGLLRAAVGNSAVSQAKSRAALGWNPRPVRTSLQDSYTFFVEQGWLTPSAPRRPLAQAG
jgi:dihydroflavonol-4-reductase